MTTTEPREAIRHAIEEATHQGLSVADPLPDALAATADANGIPLHAVIAWIHDGPEHDLTTAHMLTWARRWGIATCNAPAE